MRWRRWTIEWPVDSGRKDGKCKLRTVVVAGTYTHSSGLVSVEWVIDAETGERLDLGKFMVAERLGLYEAVREAERSGLCGECGR